MDESRHQFFNNLLNTWQGLFKTQGATMADPIVHFDISGPDLEPLARFYSELFGWNISEGGPGYSQVDSGSGLRGGLVEAEASTVNIGIQVDDLAAAVQQAEQLGGKVVMPATDNGWVLKAQVQDPAGNLMSLIQADEKSQA